MCSPPTPPSLVVHRSSREPVDCVKLRPSEVARRQHERLRSGYGHRGGTGLSVVTSSVADVTARRSSVTPQVTTGWSTRGQSGSPIPKHRPTGADQRPTGYRREEQKMSSEDRIRQAVMTYLKERQGAAGLYDVAREVARREYVSESEVSAVVVRESDEYEVDWLEGRVKALPSLV